MPITEIILQIFFGQSIFIYTKIDLQIYQCSIYHLNKSIPIAGNPCRHCQDYKTCNALSE